MTTTTTKTENPIIIVCDDCAVGLANDDWTWLDYAQDDEVSASCAAFVESAGLLTSLSGTDAGREAEATASESYYQCPCCGCDALGGRAFTS